LRRQHSRRLLPSAPSYDWAVLAYLVLSIIPIEHLLYKSRFYYFWKLSSSNPIHKYIQCPTVPSSAATIKHLR
jgi:hypothetical protein